MLRDKLKAEIDLAQTNYYSNKLKSQYLQKNQISKDTILEVQYHCILLCNSNSFKTTL